MSSDRSDGFRLTMVAPRLARARDQELAYRERMRRAFISLTDAAEQLNRAFQKAAASSIRGAAQFAKLGEALRSRPGDEQ